MKNFNSFLQNGKEISDRCSSFDLESVDDKKNTNVEQSTESNESSASEEIKMITSNPKVRIDIENALKLIAADSKNRSELDISNNAERIPNGSMQIETSNMKLEIKDDRELDEGVRQFESIDYNADTCTATVGKPQLKAKFLRQQRRAEKQMAKADSEVESSQKLPTKKLPKSLEKTLRTLIEEMPTNGKHKLKVCIQ